MLPVLPIPTPVIVAIPEAKLTLKFVPKSIDVVTPTEDPLSATNTPPTEITPVRYVPSP